MKFKRTITILLLLASLLLTGCDQLIEGYLQDYFQNVSEGSEKESFSDEDSKPTEPLHEASGTLYSKESETLVLFADWEAVSYDEKKATVTVMVGIRCYGITTGHHELTVTVNGNSQTFRTKPIESTKKQEKIFKFNTFVFEVDLTKSYQNVLDISALWDYNGTYIGQPIESLTATAKIRFPGGEIIDTDESTSDATDTSEPNKDPDAPKFQESGKIYSSESRMLILYADWTAISKDGKTITVTVSPGIECYSLTTESHKLTIRVNDQSITYNTRGINHKVSEKAILPFESKEFEFDEVKLDGEEPYLLSISVIWEYNDDDGYSQEIIEEFKAEITVTFPGGVEVPTDSNAEENQLDEQNELTVP